MPYFKTLSSRGTMMMAWGPIMPPLWDTQNDPLVILVDDGLKPSTEQAIV